MSNEQGTEHSTDERLTRLEIRYEIALQAVYDTQAQINKTISILADSIRTVSSKLSTMRNGVYIATFFVGFIAAVVGWDISRFVNLKDQIDLSQDQKLYEMHSENAQQISSLWEHVNLLEGKK